MKSEQNKNIGYLSGIINNFKILKEIWSLIITNKKWWLIPFFIVFGFVTIFIALVGGAAVLPAIYAIF